MMVRFNNGIIMVRNNAITLFIKQKNTSTPIYVEKHANLPL